MNLHFNLLNDERITDAYAVLKLVGKAIEAAGRRQRISKLTFETYEQWHHERANYIVTLENAIVGLVTLRRETLQGWSDVEDCEDAWMLRALATHPDYQGKGIGSFAVRRAVQSLDTNQIVYLDCVSAYLPGFYKRLGFDEISQQPRLFDGAEYDVTLMRYVVGDEI